MASLDVNNGVLALALHPLIQLRACVGELVAHIDGALEGCLPGTRLVGGVTEAVYLTATLCE